MSEPNAPPRASPLLKQQSWSPESKPNAPPRASPLLKQQSWSPESKPNAQPRASPLLKQQSWSPDMLRDEAWSRRKGHHKLRRSQSSLRRTVTDYDLDELKACFELGFGFDSPDIDPKLSETFPALEFYQKVNKQYSQSLSRTTSSSSSTAVPDSDKSSCSIESPSSSIFDPDDDPETMKTRLRQWAQVVACVVRQS